MSKIKRFISLFLILSVVVTLTACSTEKPRKVGKYTTKIVVNSVDSSIVAENDNYSMRWDNEKACILIEDKNSGYIWSTVPNDFYNGTPAGARADVLLNSPIIVTYITSQNNTLKTLNGSSVFEDGFITAKKVKNGIQVGYFFNNLEISVPVTYKLYDDHFTVTVDPAGILENENRVYQIEIAPFLTAIPANADKSDYLFVPSGSGALMYVDERDGTARNYEEAVYGEDLAAYNDHISEKNYGASLPVFGVKRGDNAIFAIIEEGAASCDIIASAGDSTIGYSNVCATFSVRGHNTEVVSMSAGGAQRVNNYSDGLINEKCTIAYYFLNGENADYSGMAKCYREYLSNRYEIEKSAEDSSLYLQFLGGAMAEKSFVGFPYKKLEAATTVEEATEIVKDITSATGATPTVQLKGFGETGIDVGKIGGGYKLNSNLGSWKDVSALKEISEVYFDFDLMSFDTSANGFKVTPNSAKAENGGTAYQYRYTVAAENIDEDDSRYRLLSRNKLSTALDKAVNVLTKKEISGVSLSTLGSQTYSDYQSPKYYSKGNTDSDISAMLSGAKKKIDIMTSNANTYAAANSKHIIETPSSNSGYNSLDVEIPFYRMVFKGTASISSKSLNTVSERRVEFLKAAETGCGLLYTVINDYSSEFRLSDSSFAKSVYSDIKEIIVSDYNEIGEFLSLVSNTGIKTHTILYKGVNQTVFENGVTVVVNYTNSAVETELGTVEPLSFVYK